MTTIDVTSSLFWDIWVVSGFSRLYSVLGWASRWLPLCAHRWLFQQDRLLVGLLAQRIKNCFLLLGSIFFWLWSLSSIVRHIPGPHWSISFTSHGFVLSFSFSLSLLCNDSLPCIWPVDVLETQGLWRKGNKLITYTVSKWPLTVGNLTYSVHVCSVLCFLARF